MRKQLLTDAMAAFEQIADVPVVITNAIVDGKQGHYPDAGIQLGDETWYAEIKPNLSAGNLGQVAAQFARFDAPTLLITRYATPQMADRLKALDVPFVDTAGNAYIRTEGLLIFIKGQKPQRPAIAEKPTRAFNATGLKVLFALLCQPELIAASYREIAELTGVALGTIGWVINDLKRFGYVMETKTAGRTITKYQELLDAWVEAYPRELRPRLHPKRFHVDEPHWWHDVNWRVYNAWLGGEPAAAELTHYLKPQIITVYGGDGLKQLFREKRFRQDPNGDVEVMDAFWHFDYEWQHAHLAPPILIYAELVATADARNLETARRLYDQYLV